MNKWIGITVHKLAANPMLKLCCRNYYLLGLWRLPCFSPGTAYACKIFISSRTNYHSVNGMLAEAYRHCA